MENNNEFGLYSFDEICAAGSCVDYVREVLHAPVEGGRCAAVWRGGDNATAVHIDKDQWYDHKAKEGGSLIQLCAKAQFNGNLQAAQNFLGHWLHLTPKMVRTKRKPQFLREKMLKESGYTEVKRYIYTDEDGKPAHITLRFEKPGHKKEFVQRTEDSDNLEGVRTCLYNLPAVIKADTVVIAEGEKDAETLIAWGFTGTTAPMGALKWEERFTEWLRGKHVVICRDRDDAGLAHAKILVRHLLGVAADIKVLCPWKTAKDVTEWAEVEGGSAIRLSAAIAASKPVSADTMLENEDEEAILKAKEANQTAFSNVAHIAGDDGKDNEVPRSIGDIIDDLHTRFLGFPRKIGDSMLFDHDRDTHRIEVISKPPELFAWIGQKSGHPVDWSRSRGCVTRDELYAGAIYAARRYESISNVPDWPKREDVYYAYTSTPKPTQNHDAFNGLLDFFAPANEESRILLRTFFAAPLYFRYGIQRPCWVVDSRDGPGVGKTTLVELLANLYVCSPIKTTQRDFSQNYAELKGNIVSDGGRSTRILLVDNVSGDFKEANFAECVTCFDFNERPKYGRSPERRPNDLTCCITANNAQLSDEIASRSFMLLMRRPDKSVASWKSQVLDYIARRRWEIFGDMIAILSNGRPFDVAAQTRVPEFEREVVMPMSGTREAYDRAIAGVLAQRDDSNADMDIARQAEEAIRINLGRINLDADRTVAFLRTEVIKEWCGDIGLTVQKVRELVATRLLDCVSNDRRNMLYPRGHGMRARIPPRRGLMWIGRGVTAAASVQVVGRLQNGNFGVVGAVVGDNIIDEELAGRQAQTVDVEEEAVVNPTLMPPPAPLPPPTQPALNFNPQDEEPVLEDVGTDPCI